MEKKSRGSLIDFMMVLLTIVAMLAVLVVFFQVSELLIVRMDVSQTTRRYLLRMETKGYLEESDRTALLDELAGLGLKDIDLSGSTCSPVAYGETIVLIIRGKITGSSINDGGGWPYESVQRDYEVEEKRMSTAKN
ncbi:MAG: hypothetical protein IJZ82_10095 [Lachnospiraceae bacterium]|nr:hypothetical protein [Lachnospiraceae bacterium]